jgi:peptidoglycan/LPS O-acetylase OafA/YrhL
MQLKLLPAERMNVDYPWSLWAIGWLAIFKAVLWLAYEPVLPEAILRLVGWKYLLGAVPMLICGVALWRRRRWAAWGLAVLAAADLVLIVVVPPTLQAYLVDSEVMIFSILLSAVVLVCGGPVGDVLILCGVPAMFRNTRKADR